MSQITAAPQNCAHDIGATDSTDDALLLELREPQQRLPVGESQRGTGQRFAQFRVPGSFRQGMGVDKTDIAACRRSETLVEVRERLLEPESGHRKLAQLNIDSHVD